MSNTAHFGEESDWNLPTELRPALRQLLLAHNYSGDVVIDPWQFAISIGSLHACGLVENDFRWMLGKGFVDHRSETTLVGESVRSFRQAAGATFSDQSCFILTFTGVEFAKSFLSENETPTKHFQNGKPRSNGRGGSQATNGATRQLGEKDMRPHWDADRRELHLGKALVKKYMVPAPCQTQLLDAFQEEAWTDQIDDPLPQTPNSDAKERLRNTIKALNRNQQGHLLQFTMAGSGEAVRWALKPRE